MKKVVALFAIVVASMALVAGTASASGGGGTVVDSGFACALLDGNGGIIVTYNSTLTVYSNQQSTKAVLRCEGWGAGASSLTYFNYANTGLTCGSQFGSTTNWSDKVGRNGNSQLTCTFTPNGEVSAGGSAGLG